MSIILIWCKDGPKHLKSSKVKFEYFEFNINNLVLHEYTNDYMINSQEFRIDTVELRGLDYYTCIIHSLCP